MIFIQKPGQEPLEIESILIDFEGTLATDKRVHPKTKDKINLLSKRTKIYILTKGEQELVAEVLRKVKAEVIYLKEGETYPVLKPGDYGKSKDGVWFCRPPINARLALAGRGGRVGGHARPRHLERRDPARRRPVPDRRVAREPRAIADGHPPDGRGVVRPAHREAVVQRQTGLLPAGL